MSQCCIWRLLESLTEQSCKCLVCAYHNTLMHADHTYGITASSKLGVLYAKEARSKVTFYWRAHVHLHEIVKVDNVPIALMPEP